MRDQHRDKRELVNEVTDLRKQVADLKQAAVERRRIEDGLRRDQTLLRALVDRTPLPLCLVTPVGLPLLANQAFVDLLGYSSVGELVRLGGELGLVVGDPNLNPGRSLGPATDLTFRRSDGSDLVAPVIWSNAPDAEYLAVVVLANQQVA